jgi:hypothetical protein
VVAFILRLAIIYELIIVGIFVVHTSKVSRYRITMFTCRGESSHLILVEGHIVEGSCRS